MIFFVVYSLLTQQCLYWFDVKYPDIHHPCGFEEIYVPESAERIDL